MDCTSDFIQICMPSFCRTGFELFHSCGSENIFSLVVGSNGKLLCVSKTSGRTASGIFKFKYRPSAEVFMLWQPVPKGTFFGLMR